MARKQDKLRPYRVDYFNIDEMKDNDMALVRSVIVRAVTSAEAATQVLTDNETLPIVLIRSYRFYKQITNKKDVFKAVEDLFTEKNALIVMDEVEKYRAAQSQTNDLGNTPAAQTQMDAVAAQADAALDASNGHVTRFSDSSLYDEVCTKCGATDTSGKLEDPCPGAHEPTWSGGLKIPVTADHATPDPAFGVERATFYKTNAGTQIQSPTSGPDSPATVAAVADLNGMLSHDAHEQAMDTFVPDSVPAGRTFPANADMHTEVTPFGEKCPECEDTCPMPGTPDLRGGVAPTWQKILLFAGMIGVSILLLWLILPHK